MRTSALVLLAAMALAMGCGREPSDGGSGSTSGSGSSSGSTGASGSTGESGSSGGSSGGSVFQIVACDDAGPNPCGSAGLAIDSAQVLVDPFSVLAASVRITSHGAESVVVLAQGGGTLQVTPASPATAGDQTLPVLGLAPQTDYAIQVLATDGNGNYARSPVLGLTTGALPGFVNASFSVARSGTVEPGYILVTKLPVDPTLTPLPAIVVDRRGRVAWYATGPTSLYGDFKKQPDHTYTFGAFQADGFPGSLTVSYASVDSLGEPLGLYTVPDPDGGTDNHEFTLLPDHDALMIGETARTLDTTQFGGGVDTLVVEQTLWRIHPDGGVAFHWDAFDHTDISDLSPAFGPRSANPLDATHLNAFNVTPDGNYLASLRQMSQVLKIDAQTGEVMWKLGEHGDFTFIDDPLNGFSGQHNAQEIAPDDILIYDDGNEHQPPQSRAVEYRLDRNAMTASLIWSFSPTPMLYGFAMGSVQRLPNGNTLIAYGTVSRIDEVDPQGNIVWQLLDDQPGFGFYRAQFVDSLY